MELSTPDCEIYVKEVWSGKKWYTSMRKDGVRAVCVKWGDDTSTIEPVTNLIDFEKKEITEKMIPVLCNWEIGAKTFNHSKRKCAFCDMYSKCGEFVCEECKISESWLQDYIDNEKIKRENITVYNNVCNVYKKPKIDVSSYAMAGPVIHSVPFPKNLSRGIKRKNSETELDLIEFKKMIDLI